MTFLHLPVTIGAPQTWTIDHGRVTVADLNVANPLTVALGPSGHLVGDLSGSAPITVSGIDFIEELSLEGNGYRGDITANAKARVFLSGTTGGLLISGDSLCDTLYCSSAFVQLSSGAAVSKITVTNGALYVVGLAGADSLALDETAIYATSVGDGSTLTVSGPVSLGSTTLEVLPRFKIPAGTVFTLIENKSGSPRATVDGERRIIYRPRVGYSLQPRAEHATYKLDNLAWNNGVFVIGVNGA